MYKLDTQKITYEEKYDGTLVTISLPREKRNNLYFRFAIKGDFLDAYFLSVMSYEPLVSTTMFKTELFEFRLNSNRHLSPSLLEHIRQNQIFSLCRVHFFFMISAEEDILHANSGELQGRLLEPQIWKGYFGDKSADLKKNPVIAYHFKKDSKNDEGLEQYSLLVKTKGRRSPWLAWVFYLLIILSIGLVTEGISQFLFSQKTECQCQENIEQSNIHEAAINNTTQL
ncbi:MAG: hypothetical protein QNL04_00235 [SAR324 cluster bacterium]|nr:hypothetical protein [SAR324 cluster bacterium]